MSSAAAHYRLMEKELKARCHAIDDETLHDPLQGHSGLPQMTEALLRSPVEDEMFLVGLKARLERHSRVKGRHDKNAS